MSARDDAPQTPIARFLGVHADRPGPAALLGLDAGALNEAAIMQARDRCLARIDAHPQSQSAAADEVRLAVVAATAQLMNPAVRSHLGQSRSLGARRSALDAFEHDLILTLGMYGGWTRRSLPRLLALAHARGLNASDVATTLAHLARKRRPVPAPRGVLAPGTVDLDSMTPRGTHAGWIVTCAAVITVLLASLLMRGIIGSNEAPPSTIAEQQTPLPMPLPIPRATNAASPLQNEPSAELEPTQIIPTFEHAVRALAVDPAQGLRSGRLAIESMGRHWLSLSADERRRAADAVVELLYRLGSSPSSARVLLDALEAGLGTAPIGQAPSAALVTSNAWTCGVLNRLRRERDLPSSVLARVDALLAQSLRDVVPARPTLEEGVLASLLVQIDLLSRTRATRLAWESWVSALEAATPSDVERRSTLLLRALDAVVATPAEERRPSQNRDAMRVLVSRLPWTLSSMPQQWLLRQFDHRGVSTESMSALTQTIVADARVPEIDPTMVLAANATELDRRDLRDRYAAIWNLDAPAQDQTLTQSIQRAVQTIATQHAATQSDDQQLATTVRWARLNTALAALWSGAVDRAALWAEAATENLTSTSAAGRAAINPQSGTATWAEQYLSAGTHIEQRLELLTQFRAGASLSTVDAEVIMREALRSSNRQIRTRARELVLNSAASPAIVNALLEEAPRIPPTRDSHEFIVAITLSPLPDVNSPMWRAAARRAIVERLIELLVGDSASARIDELALLLEEAYGDQIEPDGSVAGSGDRISRSASQSAALMLERWRLLAQRLAPPSTLGLSLAGIERSRSSRMALARGMIEEFHVQQLALVETMALVVASERPAAFGSVRAVLDDLARERSAATHILSQLASCERAISRLWLVRLGIEEQNP